MSTQPLVVRPEDLDAPLVVRPEELDQPVAKPAPTANLPGATPRLLAAASNAPAVMTKPTQFERDRPGEGISLKGAGTAAWEGVKGLGRGIVSQLDPTTGLSGAGLSAIGLNPRKETAGQHLEEIPIVSAGREAKAGWERETTPVGKSVEAITSGLGSLAGVSASRSAEHAARGEGGAIIGEAAVPAATIALSPLAEPIVRGTGKMAGAFREGVGGAIHEPETGAMTKGTEQLSRAGGAVIGGAAGGGIGSIFGPRGIYAGTVTGATAGGLAGPALMERIFPEPAARIAGREEFARTKTLTEAQEGATAENAAREKAARVEQAKVARTAQKAAADAEAARAKLESDSMARMKMTQSLEDATKKAQKELAAHRSAMEKADMERMNFANSLEKATGKEAQTARAKMESDSVARAKMTKSLEDAVEKAKQDELDNIKQSHAEHAQQVKELEDARQKELAANEKLKEQHAAALNRRGEVAKMTPPTETGGTPQGNATPFGNPQDLITRTKKLVVPGERPTAEQLKRAGDATQWSLPRLKLLASFGDELAKNEIIRRQQNELGFSRAPLPRGNVPPTPVTPMTPPRIPIEEKIKELRPPSYKPSEKVETMSAPTKNLGKEFEQGEVSHEIARNKEILRNPKATAEDKRVATARLKELSHP